ncbi:serine hydrolase domain-containing protein [Nannocystis pusilla]|uniref:Beta-lactamase family protein n=1 Tax=Nannocystis pusilla TaxID=889268 RepID=A0ABS7TM36_9BACT|nr:serine hydrolase domain-containing protein [Nannocystis pusilla]MBZ5709202.1 beta-lactamase family protein [Nannocystis pusilla]
MNRHNRGARWAPAAAWALLAACEANEPPPQCPSAIAAAESVYRDCIAELGLMASRLTISVAGDIEVEFDGSYTPEKGELAQRTCEPPMEEALALGLLACETTEVGVPATAERLREQVERAGERGFSGSVAIVRDGALVWRGGVGLADRERGLANDSRTAFDCGSIMKVMTAAAIFQLEAEALLARDDRLGELLDGVPADKAAITLAQVLTHRAGFDEYHDTQGDFEAMDRATALQRIFAQELRFAPGTAEAYSNSGYTLLAAVVEEASGVPFPEYLQARLFAPAMMTRTGLYGDDIWPEGQVAVGYDEDRFGCNSPACWPAPSWALMGNGGLVSTVDDLVRWSAAVEAGVLFDADTRDAFRSEVLGARTLTIDGEPAHAYSGRNDFGFGAAVGEVPGRRTWVAVAANAAGNHNNSALLAQLVQMSLGALIELEP